MSATAIATPTGVALPVVEDCSRVLTGPACPREASATPSGSAGPGPRRLGWWARVAGLGFVVALLAVGGGRAAPTTNPATQPPLVEADRLVANDGENREHFGFAVAVDGNTLAVGSSHATVGSHATRAPCTCTCASAAKWTLQAKLTAEDGATDDQLGYAVALRGDLLVAGAPYHDRDHGAVYTFRRTGSSGPRTKDHRPHERRRRPVRVGARPVRRDAGRQLPLRGPQNDRRRRRALVHRHARPRSVPSPSTEAGRLTASDPDSHDNFGVSVALDGDPLLVGAPPATHRPTIGVRVRLHAQRRDLDAASNG